MESYEFKNCDEAIKKLTALKRKGRDGKIIIFTTDFDNENKAFDKFVATPDYGCLLVKKSKTIIINEDTFIPHMQLYSIKQPDLENIIKTGIMHDIIFGNG